MATGRPDIVDIGQAQLTTVTWGDGVPELIMLHDGLGSVRQWRDVPADLASATGLTVMAYDRAGHGNSTPIPSQPWPADWLHHEAVILGQLIDAVGAESPVLVGHSDGGSIAAILAANGGTIQSMVLLAAHSWVEPMTVEAIADMCRRANTIIERLVPFHNDAAAIFEAWSGVWVGDSFSGWDVRPTLKSIGVPTLVLQGARDEFAPPEHAVATAAAIGANASFQILPSLGHLLPHQAPELIIETIAEFVESQRFTPRERDQPDM
ncbi:MAG: alpha/beta hydrolase [Actinomycetia bacterium]|nr:alpha/beta hydrolase [Actinomycetes bacterium]